MRGMRNPAFKMGKAIRRAGFSPSAFEVPWRWHVGVISGAMNFVIDEAEVISATREQLRAELEGRASAARTDQLWF